MNDDCARNRKGNSAHVADSDSRIYGPDTRENAGDLAIVFGIAKQVARHVQTVLHCAQAVMGPLAKIQMAAIAVFLCICGDSPRTVAQELSQRMEQVHCTGKQMRQSKSASTTSLAG